MKVCSACGIEKEMSMFGRHAKGRLGLHSKCRACISEYGKFRYLSMRSDIRQKENAKRAANSEETRRSGREYMRNSAETLANHYVRKLLTMAGFELFEITDELVKMKREQIVIRRMAALLRKSKIKETQI